MDADSCEGAESADHSVAPMRPMAWSLVELSCGNQSMELAMTLKRWTTIGIFTAVFFSLPFIVNAQVNTASTAATNSSGPTAPASTGTISAIPLNNNETNPIPPGTIITMQNWQQYRAFMPDGMAALFAGGSFWKMPADVQMPVGPTIIHPLPVNYMAATEKYAAQVRIAELPEGGLTLTGYNGGIPFPQPAEPHEGWKILANLWYRYTPHLTVNTRGVVCFVDSGNRVSCKAGMKVYRQLSFNTDPGVPSTFPGAADKYFTQYEMVEEPEQERYTAVLTISNADLTQPEQVYVFIPALRRYQPLSPSARCSPDLGTDETPDDRRYGFDSNLTQLSAQYMGTKKILALLNYTMPTGRFPENYDMPLGWPMPSWGKWQLRDVYQISVSKLPSRSSGYCFAKRIIYVDAATYAPLWEDLYDSHMQPKRSIALFLHTIDIPGIGPQDSSNSMIYGIWDVQTEHATIFAEPGDDQAFYVNQQAPDQYNDLDRYTTANGLNMIMR
jgi:hypothetical protein